MPPQTQLDIVIGLLRERGPEGVTARELIYKHGITRSAALIWRLRHERGWLIDTYQKAGHTALYILVSEDPSPRQLELALS